MKTNCCVNKSRDLSLNSSINIHNAIYILILQRIIASLLDMGGDLMDNSEVNLNEHNS